MIKKFALMALPMMAALMIGTSLVPANATGIFCGEGGPVVHGVQNNKGASHQFDDVSGFAQFFWGQTNCNNDKGAHETFGFFFVNTGSCSTSQDVTKANFEWGFESTILTVDGTACGDIRVEWTGDGNTQKNEFASSNDENCHDGKQVTTFMTKFQNSEATLYVDGTEVSTSTDLAGGNIFRGSSMILDCEDRDSP
jgi:hypothetical protein